MASAKVVLTLFFVLTLGAGLVAGMLVARPPMARAAAAATRPTARTPLGAELGLSADQSLRMHDIWEGVRDEVDACFRRAQEAQQRRDAALVALLSEQQKAVLAQAQQDYTDTVKALKSQRDAAFQQAVQRTEQILNDSQRKRYRQILDSRLGQEAANPSPDWIAPQLATSRPANAAHQGKE
jgi:Skp family chaperone for outer membrane proteins